MPQYGNWIIERNCLARLFSNAHQSRREAETVSLSCTGDPTKTWRLRFESVELTFSLANVLPSFNTHETNTELKVLHLESKTGH